MTQEAPPQRLRWKVTEGEGGRRYKERKEGGEVESVARQKAICITAPLSFSYLSYSIPSSKHTTAIEIDNSLQRVVGDEEAEI